jgi:D-beta-D-heptose 7-phosphate kinase/D-beta-D-heptose 1-phosphate adenosyltransferase
MLFTLPALLDSVEDERYRGHTIVAANGCFDVLHAGHVALLREGRAQGDVLVVLLNSDASIRRLKGPARPVHPLEDRALVISALACVDYVTAFDEDTPAAILESLRPDVLVKGADWSGQTVAGCEYAGRLHLVKLLPGRSTTATLAAIG